MNLRIYLWILVMSTDYYDFDVQLKKGEKGEAVLDKFFSRHYSIQYVSQEVQRIGIDRIFITKLNTYYTIEYKTDWTARKTGNAFIEIMSVDKTKKYGWAYTSGAQIIVYFIPINNDVYMLNPLKLKQKIPKWLDIYKKQEIPNNGYNTIGLLVPLSEIGKISFYSTLLSI